jgi:hypothetical protein
MPEREVLRAAARLIDAATDHPESAVGVPLDIHYAIDRLSLAADGVLENTSEHAG